MENNKKKLSGFQLQPIYPLSFKFISNIEINKDRWSKGRVSFGDTPLLQPAFDSCPPCPPEQFVLRGPGQLKIMVQAPASSSRALWKCASRAGVWSCSCWGLVAAQGEVLPALSEAQNIPELHRGKFHSGMMETSFTGISIMRFPLESLTWYTTVAMLFFKNLHMYVSFGVWL